MELVFAGLVVVSDRFCFHQLISTAMANGVSTQWHLLVVVTRYWANGTDLAGSHPSLWDI